MLNVPWFNFHCTLLKVMGGIKKEEVENNLTGLKGSKDNVHITQVY